MTLFMAYYIRRFVYSYLLLSRATNFTSIQLLWCALDSECNKSFTRIVEFHNEILLISLGRYYNKLVLFVNACEQYYYDTTLVYTKRRAS